MMSNRLLPNLHLARLPFRTRIASTLLSFQYTNSRAMATNTGAATANTPTGSASWNNTERLTNETLPLPEPSSDSKATELNVSDGQGVTLDYLGPMVVNRDGTLSRVANWEQMTDIERRNSLRILGKRNQLRMESLKAEEAASSTAE